MSRRREVAFKRQHASGKHRLNDGRDIGFAFYDAICALRDPFSAENVCDIAGLGERLVQRRLKGYVRNGLLTRQRSGSVGGRYEYCITEGFRQYRPSFTGGLVLGAVWCSLNYKPYVKDVVEVMSEAIETLLSLRGGKDAIDRDRTGAKEAVRKEISALVRMGNVVRVGSDKLRIVPTARRCPVMSKKKPMAACDAKPAASIPSGATDVSERVSGEVAPVGGAAGSSCD